MQKTYFYDAESFPNFACFTFLSTDGELEQFSFGMGYNDLKRLKEFISPERLLLVGFNSISYDDPVLRFTLSQKDARDLPKKLFALSGKLVSDKFRSDNEIKTLRYRRDAFSFQWDTIDLFKVMRFDMLGVSLKQVGILLGHEKIQDLPFPYNHVIANVDEVETVLLYNRNDVDITKKLYWRVQDEINLRKDIGELYGVDVINASDSKIGNVVLEHYYEEEYGIDLSTVRNLRTKRISVDLKDCIPDVISFTAPEFVELYDKIQNTTVYVWEDFKFSEQVVFRGLGYSIGSGGIHSTESSCRFDSTDDIAIMTCDIASMYPNCIIINNIYPEHLDERFVRVLATLTAERLEAKRNKNKVKAEALKITVNGLYGKLNSDTFWVEDAKAMLRVTIAGQLYILMLVEMLDAVGIKTISANTDGIECEVPKSKMDTYYSTCKEWEAKTGFTLEYGQYAHYIKRDVNNYIAISVDGTVKTKGAYVPKISLAKSYKHPIVQKAVHDWYVKGVPVEDTIKGCTDILQFCISQKMGKQFRAELHTLSGVVELQKTNRFYITRYGGSLIKRNVDHESKQFNRTTGLFVGKMVRILNDYNPSDPFESYMVNYDFYIGEARSLIEEVDPVAKQSLMFDMEEMMSGKRVNMAGETISKKKKKKITDAPVTREEVADADVLKMIYDLPSRLALVTTTDITYSPRVKLYSLSKGTIASFKVKKEVFNANPLRRGSVVKLLEFEERPKYKREGDKFVEIAGQKEWWVMSYEIVNDVSNFKRKVR